MLDTADDWRWWRERFAHTLVVAGDHDHARDAEFAQCLQRFRRALPCSVEQSYRAQVTFALPDHHRSASGFTQLRNGGRCRFSQRCDTVGAEHLVVGRLGRKCRVECVAGHRLSKGSKGKVMLINRQSKSKLIIFMRR